MELTPQQAAAVTTQGRSVILEAGAGTGKTWTLVQRFLYLLDAHPAWPLESIVAVTFTEKAAREMRSRIRDGVEAAAAEAPPGSHWHQRRLELNRLRVSTIHSLCARILRENAIAAGVDPRFDVLDEQAGDLLKEEALRQTLAWLAENEQPALELLVSLNVRDLETELTTLLGQRGTVARLFANLPASESLVERWREGVARMRQQIVREALRSLPDLEPALAQLPAVDIVDPDDKLASSVMCAQQGCRHIADGDIVAAAECFVEINLRGGRQANWGGKEALAELKDWLRAVRAVGKEVIDIPEVGDADEEAAAALHKWRDLWTALTATYDRLKAEQHTLDFDDLEIMAERLLYSRAQDGRLAAFLAGINHLMVDEYQDTNEVQQRIIYALAHPEDGGRLFVVGDVKQSIYRFRQAQVTVFHATADDIQAATGDPPLHLSLSFRTHAALVAAVNHAFDSIFQPLGASHADFEARPGALTAARPTPGPHPAAPAPVELWVLPRQDSAGERINAEAARIWEAQLLAERLLELAAERMPVYDRRADGYRAFEFGDAAILFRATTSLPLYEEVFQQAGLPYLTVSGRGYYDRPEVRDLIALLAALHNPADDLAVATALRAPLFSLSDETLYWLRWRTADGERATDPIPFRQALAAAPHTAQPDAVARTAVVLDDLWAMTGRASVWRLLRTALDRTGYLAALTPPNPPSPSFLGEGGRKVDAPLTLSSTEQDERGRSTPPLSRHLGRGGVGGGEGARRSGNVAKLLELARDQAGASLSEFLRRVEDLRAREAREGEALAAADAGAVQLMSVHAAKGLEFPVVAVADLGRSSSGSWGSARRVLHDPAFGLACMSRDERGEWQKPASYRWARWLEDRMEAAESKRLLYVACTRAADLLLLSGRAETGNCWLNDLAGAWRVELDGPPEETVAHDGFTVHVRRPEPVEGRRPEEPPAVSTTAPAVERRPVSPGLEEVPPLAGPLPTSDVRPQSVTHLVRRLAEAAGEEASVPSALALHAAEEDAGRVSGRVLGRMIHRALADWDCLALPEPQLKAWLWDLACQEGVTAEAALGRAVGVAYAVLGRVRRSHRYNSIDGARRRYTEFPFTVVSPVGPLHGVIDLVYQDAAGSWRVVDWKTEWLKEGAAERQAQIESHLPQLAVAALAAEQALSARVHAALCFLSPDFAEYTYDSGDLQPVWDQLSQDE